MSDDLMHDLRACGNHNLDASDSQWVDHLTNRAAARIKALETALRWTWDYLAPDEDVEVDGGPECGPVTVNVRHDIITALMEDEQFTEERSAQLEAVIREALDA